jgi:hypothetical protein
MVAYIGPICTSIIKVRNFENFGFRIARSLHVYIRARANERVSKPIAAVMRTVKKRQIVEQKDQPARSNACIEALIC